MDMGVGIGAPAWAFRSFQLTGDHNAAVAGCADCQSHG
jgi:hypothetical protein